MKTKLMIVLCSVTILCCADAFGLGFVYPSNRPVIGGASWPKGMTPLVNSTNRVYGYGVNGTDVFSFSGAATNFTAFLAEYSRISGVDKHRLILHEGVGQPFSAWENASPAFDWKIKGCPKGWHYVTAHLGSTNTNSVEVLKKMMAEPGYVLEVHFWTGSRIALEQAVVPPNVEVAKAR